MADESQTISFRVPPGLAKQLEDEGAKDGLSRNEHARKLVIAAMAGPTTVDLLTELQELKSSLLASAAFRIADRTKTVTEMTRLDRSLEELRQAFATGVACLLVQAANVEQEEAEAWVRTNMFSAVD